LLFTIYLIERNLDASFVQAYPEDAPNVVFSCGAIVRGDELWLYYGAADCRLCLATAKIKDILAAVTSENTGC